MPDVELKPQVYTDDRPEEYFEQFHARARRGPAGWTYELTRFVLVPYLLVAFRARALGTENVPNGPVILAPNHGSFMDHFFAGAFIRRRVRFMAKSQLFKRGLATYIYSHGGVFPVRRGQHDEEAFVTSFSLLGRGEAIVMYPEGGRSRTGELAEQAKPGLGRLALESGAPVVPIAILGSHQVRNWKRLQFPRVTIQFGAPLRFDRVENSTREQQQEVSDLVLDRIRELHSQLKLLGHRGALKAARDRRKEGRRVIDERYAQEEMRLEQERRRQEEEREELEAREKEAQEEQERRARASEKEEREKDEDEEGGDDNGEDEKGEDEKGEDEKGDDEKGDDDKGEEKGEDEAGAG